MKAYFEVLNFTSIGVGWIEKNYQKHSYSGLIRYKIEREKEKKKGEHHPFLLI